MHTRSDGDSEGKSDMKNLDIDGSVIFTYIVFYNLL